MQLAESAYGLDPDKLLEARLSHQIWLVSRYCKLRTVVIGHSMPSAMAKIDEIRESLDDGVDYRALSPEGWDHYGFRCTRLYVAHTLFNSADILQMIESLGNRQRVTLVVRDEADFSIVEDWDL